MTKKHTKSALFTSVMALILCCAMLVGTTLAWFTDNVNSGVNKIQSGNLDIGVYYALPADVVDGDVPADAWKPVTEEKSLFNQEALWEPGYTEVVFFKFVNEGNLALQYQMKVDILNEVLGKTKDGADIQLSNYIQAYACNTFSWNYKDYLFTDRENATNPSGAPDPFHDTLFNAANGEAATPSGENPLSLDSWQWLEPIADGATEGESTYATLVLWMPTEVGNEANHNGKDIPSIDLGINVVATQYNWEEEKDSFDHNYDEKAEYDALVFPDAIIEGSDDKDANSAALNDAINAGDTDKDGIVALNLGAGEYKMPSVTESKEITITGTKDTVIDNTLGAYLDSSKVSFEGVTIKGSTGKANGNGSDYAALYTPNVTYTNCTFDGPFRIGRDGATFINCTFTNLGNDYVWTYGNDATFKGCTFNSDGKALLIYSDGGSEVSKVVVENCVFNATQGAKAGAIANQNCAAIEIDNYGNGVNLTCSGNTVDSDFSGEWRIKSYDSNKTDVIVNGTEYTSIAIDGKTMTKDASNNVTVNG